MTTTATNDIKEIKCSCKLDGLMFVEPHRRYAITMNPFANEEFIMSWIILSKCHVLFLVHFSSFFLHSKIILVKYDEHNLFLFILFFWNTFSWSRMRFYCIPNWMKSCWADWDGQKILQINFCVWMTKSRSNNKLDSNTSSFEFND